MLLFEVIQEVINNGFTFSISRNEFDKTMHIKITNVVTNRTTEIKIREGDENERALLFSIGDVMQDFKKDSPVLFPRRSRESLRTVTLNDFSKVGMLKK